MKIALYIEDGLEQIVLTPEGDTEKAILAKIHDGSRELSIKRGAFYECRGGWVRHGRGTEDDSTMIVLRPVPRPQVDPVSIMAAMGVEQIRATHGQPGASEAAPVTDQPQVFHFGTLDEAREFYRDQPGRHEVRIGGVPGIPMRIKIEPGASEGAPSDTPGPEAP